MRDIALTLSFCVLVPFILMRPSVGILVWSWLGYMNPHRLTFGFAFALPFAQVTAIATFVSLIFTRDKLKIPWSGIMFLWLAFCVWLTFTTVFAIDPADSFGSWSKALKIQLFAWLTVALMYTRERMIQLVWVIALSLGFFGVKGGLWAIRTGASDRVWGPAGSFIEDNNALAMALTMIVPLLAFLITQASNKWIKRALFAAIGLTFLSIIASHSRGALLAVTSMGLVYGLRSRFKLSVLAAAIVLAPSVYFFMPQSWTDRMVTIEDYQDDKSAMGRITAWKFATDMALQRPLGGGFDAFYEENYRRYSPDIAAMIDVRDGRFQDAHSIYFKVLGEHGFVGLALFIALLIVTYRCGSYVRLHTRDRSELLWAFDLASALQASLIGFCVGGAFLGLPYFDLYYSLVALLVLLRAHVKEQTQALPNPALQEVHGRFAALPSTRTGVKQSSFSDQPR
jgi:probable O-glycosylation ligase (exosortase A-associated)